MESRRIGRFIIGPEIASGGMATVHLGRMVGPKGFGKTVALKRLHHKLLADEEFVKMFHDEARVTSGLTHANIVMTLDVLEDGEDLFLVMEYVHGASLAQIQREAGSVPLRISAGIVSAMLDGLHAAHEASDAARNPLDIIHRDVSPQNVLVTFEGVAKLADFGVARAIGRSQASEDGSAKGKISYMAPEQILSEPFTHQSDVYAAGVVLWECLTTRRLIEGKSNAEMLRAVLERVPERPSSLVEGIPVDVDAVVMRALARDPKKRFKSAKEMGIALRKALDVAHATEIAEFLATNCPKLKVERDESVAKLQSMIDSTDLLLIAEAATSSGALPVETTPPATSSEDLSSGRVAPMVFGVPRWLALAILALVSLSVVGVVLSLVSSRGSRPVASSPAPTRESAPPQTPSLEIIEVPAPSTVVAAVTASASPVHSGSLRVAVSAAPKSRFPQPTVPPKKKCRIVTSMDAAGHTQFKEICN